MLGHDPQSFRETYDGWRERLHPDDRATACKTLDDYLAGVLKTYRVEFRLRTREGRWKWILSIGKLQEWSADGRPLRMLGTHTDIDALKAAEAALLESNATLEARVAERTAELTAANQELETFAYAVSHDLRAPLRALSGYSTALQEDFGAGLNREAKGYLEHIAQAVHTMSELIDGLLALSRSTRGGLRQDRVDVSMLARRRLAELADSEPQRQVAVEVEEGIVVQGDERMLASALVNLLDNAWKYTGATPEPRIRVQAGEVGVLRGFCVSDNGAGFDMAHAGRLFKPFQRLHRQSEFPGIGIGLATVERIVHRHGGEIAVHAEPGVGATFCIGLPPLPGGPDAQRSRTIS
jgi:signal transduction histidine kinase